MTGPSLRPSGDWGDLDLPFSTLTDVETDYWGRVAKKFQAIGWEAPCSMP